MTSFDKIIDRKNTDSIKYDFPAKYGKPDGLLPLWVADMDFLSPDCVINVIKERAEYGIFGYSNSRDDYFMVLKNWFSFQFKWDIKSEWLVKTPGVVFAINNAIRAVTEVSESVLIQQPVYYPFKNAVLNNKRKLVVNQLTYNDGRYTIDFKDFENKIISNSVKLFILCSPHNPVGRVWTKDELSLMGDICLKHHVTVISDEIHADFTFPGYKHLVFADIKPEFSDITITCTAPSKTFNLAGLQISNIFIPNESLRNRFISEIKTSGYGNVNIMGITACKSAYSGGLEWLTELKEYLKCNLDFLRVFINERIPEIRLVEPQGTYLVWLDFSNLGLSAEKLDELIINKAGLWLDAGTMFGAGGDGFQRINIACPRAVLEKAFLQLEQAIIDFRKEL